MDIRDSIPSYRELSAKLQKPMLSSLGHKSIRVSYGCDVLDISFRRTVRVPDNGDAYDLPPDCGPFPIFSIKQNASKLPKEMTSKGGLFIPIYGKSITSCILFHFCRNFHIKMFTCFISEHLCVDIDVVEMTH